MMRWLIGLWGQGGRPSMELATEFATIVRWIEEDICRAVLMGMFVCCT